MALMRLDAACFDPRSRVPRVLEFFFSDSRPPTITPPGGNDRGTSYRSESILAARAEEGCRSTIASRGIEARATARSSRKVAWRSFWEAGRKHPGFLEKLSGGYTCHLVRPNGRCAASRSQRRQASPLKFLRRTGAKPKERCQPVHTGLKPLNALGSSRSRSYYDHDRRTARSACQGREVPSGRSRVTAAGVVRSRPPARPEPRPTSGHGAVLAYIERQPLFASAAIARTG